MPKYEISIDLTGKVVMEIESDNKDNALLLANAIIESNGFDDYITEYNLSDDYEIIEIES